MVIFFLLRKAFKKGTMFKWVYVFLSRDMVCHAMVSDNVVVSVYTDLLAFRRFLFLIVRGEAARQRVAKHREKNEVSRASNREHGFSWVFEERTSGARVLDMGKRSRKGAYKAITPLYLKVFNHWKKETYDPKTKSVTARTVSRFDLPAASEAETRYCKKKVLQKLIW